jgi:phosphonate transport system permease protein
VPRLAYANTSLAFLLAALACLAVADIAVSALDPWAEMGRLARGVLRPDLLSVEAWSVAWTVAFAVLGVGVGAACGFGLAILYPAFAPVRALAMALRSVHEIFWALLLMQVFGLGPATGLLAIALPYTGFFAKVFAEMIEEADLTAVEALPRGASLVSAFVYGRLPDLMQPFRTYTLYRLECGLRSTLVLGFVGLPTIGFHLESYFKQGHYAQAAALLGTFYVLIGTRRIWARPVTLPFLVLASILVLPEAVGGGSALVQPRALRRARPRALAPARPRPRRSGDLVGLRGLAAADPRRAGRPRRVPHLVLSQIALVATAILALAAFPAVSRRFAGRSGQALGRIWLVVVRSTPEYMLAYVLLQLLGPSMLPAILALSLHNAGIVGYLMGRHADTIDYRPDAPKGLNLYAFETVPRLYGQFLAYMLYRWEIIVRESAIFGILGVATLGYHVDAAISELRLDAALVLILAVVLLSAAVDALSRRLRRVAADRRPPGPTLGGGLRRADPRGGGVMRHQGPAATPVIKDVVLVGAGHAHVGVLRRFGMEPEPGVRLTLITRQVDSPYSGMLPGQVAGLYGFDDTHIDTGAALPLRRRAPLQGRSDRARPRRQRVLCRNRPPVPFDLLSINTGSTPNTGSVPGAAGRAVPVKPIDGFLDRFDALRDRVLAAGGRARIGVVGAGAGGVELLLSLERRLRRDLAAAGHDPGSLAFALVTRSDDVLPGFPKRMRERFAAILRERGIEVRTASPVVRVVEGGALQLGDGSVLPLDEILWATRASPAGWLQETGLALDGGGFIRVAPTLESVSHPGVFAAGDVAALEGHALPRSGVYAVRQGPALADNLRRALTGRALAPHKPQGDALYLVSTGEPYAIGTRNGVVVEGAWVWRLKDWIDRRFMRKFSDLPEMAPPVPRRPAAAVADAGALKEISAMAMRCGGCGAKVGATVLSRALGRHRPGGARRRGGRPRRARRCGGGRHGRAEVGDPDGRLLPRHRGRPLPVREDRRHARARRRLRHGGGAANGARHRDRALRAGGQGRGRPVADDDRGQRGAARGRLRACRRPHERRGRALARLRGDGARGPRGRPPEGRARARRRADRDEAHRHRHAARGGDARARPRRAGSRRRSSTWRPRTARRPAS